MFKVFISTSNTIENLYGSHTTGNVLVMFLTVGNIYGTVTDNSAGNLLFLDFFKMKSY